MDREPSASGLTIVSKKGMEPSSLLSSTVNLIADTVYVLKKALFVGFLVYDKGVIYIPAPELRGWGAVLRAFCSKYSMYRLATMGLTGEPMAASSTCS